MTGVIVRIAKNGIALFGFITATSGLKDIFVHRDSCYDSWEEIQNQWLVHKQVPVRFELDPNTSQLRACKVVRISEKELRLENSND